MNSSRAFRIFRGKSQLSKFGCVGETRNVENWRLMRKLTTSVRCSSRSEQPKASTIDQDDVSKFSALAHHWWKENGEFESLRRMNELRIPLIRDALAHQEKVDGNTAQPLKGLTVLDVGSGGGFIAEPLCRLGATVIGVDASEENIRVAQSHAELDPLVTGNVKYIHGSVEDLVATEEGRFDGVVASEIVEHVFNVPVFVSCCCKLVKPGGSLFMTTINKTYASYLLAIVVAENVLNFIPKGTHEWEKFVSPEDLQHLFSQNGMVTRLIHGMVYNPITCRWSWSNNSSVSYAIHAVKQT